MFVDAIVRVCELILVYLEIWIDCELILSQGVFLVWTSVDVWPVYSTEKRESFVMCCVRIKRR